MKNKKQKVDKYNNEQKYNNNIINKKENLNTLLKRMTLNFYKKSDYLNSENENSSSSDNKYKKVTKYNKRKKSKSSSSKSITSYSSSRSSLSIKEKLTKDNHKNKENKNNNKSKKHNFGNKKDNFNNYITNDDITSNESQFEKELNKYDSETDSDNSNYSNYKKTNNINKNKNIIKNSKEEGMKSNMKKIKNKNKENIKHVKDKEIKKPVDNNDKRGFLLLNTDEILSFIIKNILFFNSDFALITKIIEENKQTKENINNTINSGKHIFFLFIDLLRNKEEFTKQENDANKLNNLKHFNNLNDTSNNNNILFGLLSKSENLLNKILRQENDPNNIENKNSLFFKYVKNIDSKQYNDIFNNNNNNNNSSIIIDNNFSNNNGQNYKVKIFQGNLIIIFLLSWLKLIELFNFIINNTIISNNINNIDPLCFSNLLDKYLRIISNIIYYNDLLIHESKQYISLIKDFHNNNKDCDNNKNATNKSNEIINHYLQYVHQFYFSIQILFLNIIQQTLNTYFSLSVFYIINNSVNFVNTNTNNIKNINTTNNNKNNINSNNSNDSNFSYDFFTNDFFIKIKNNPFLVIYDCTLKIIADFTLFFNTKKTNYSSSIFITDDGLNYSQIDNNNKNTFNENDEDSDLSQYYSSSNNENKNKSSNFNYSEINNNKDNNINKNNNSININNNNYHLVIYKITESFNNVLNSIYFIFTSQDQTNVVNLLSKNNHTSNNNNSSTDENNNVNNPKFNFFNIPKEFNFQSFLKKPQILKTFSTICLSILSNKHFISHYRPNINYSNMTNNKLLNNIQTKISNINNNTSFLNFNFMFSLTCKLNHEIGEQTANNKTGNNTNNTEVNVLTQLKNNLLIEIVETSFNNFLLWYETEILGEEINLNKFLIVNINKDQVATNSLLTKFSIKFGIFFGEYDLKENDLKANINDVNTKKKTTISNISYFL